MRLELVVAAVALTACAGDRIAGPTKPEPLAISRNHEVGVITAANAPLIFVDGKEITHAELQAMKFKEIDAVQVFKGERAIGQYGARAVNGVVLITTKR